MKEFLAEVSAHHFPSPPATPAQVAAFEARVGWKLDEDLRAFYLHCDGAPLIRRFSDANDHLLPREEIRRARVAMRPGDDDRFGPASWYTLVDLQDSDYVILDAAHQVDGKDPVLDAYHETLPEAVRPMLLHAGQWRSSAGTAWRISRAGISSAFRAARS